jgi:hypothetical protein
MSAELEPALSEVETKLDEVERQAKSLLTRVKRARRMAAIGDINGIVTQLEQAPEAANRLATAFSSLDGAFAYDADEAFTNGTYVTELKQEAARQGLTLVERDGRLSAFPLILKLDPRTPGVRVGRKMVRAIRPSALVKSLKAVQLTGRFNAAGFLDQLWRAYLHLAPSPWKPQNPSDGPTVSLSQIHALLTLLPAAATDYPREAFVCDLLRLNREPDTKTRGGWSFSLPSSTGSKGQDRLTVYDERGAEHVFVGIRFLAPARTGRNE